MEGRSRVGAGDLSTDFSRNSYKEKLQFYSTALGSLSEMQNQLLIAKDIGYSSKDEYEKAAAQTITVSKVTNRLIKKTKEYIHES